MMLSSVAKRTVVSALKKDVRAITSIANSASFLKESSVKPVAFNGHYEFKPAEFIKNGTIQQQRFFSAEASPPITDAEVTELFQLWNDALATLDADTVAKRYAKKSVLLPTVSDIPRTDYEGIKSYFVDFLQKKPQGVILESNVIQGDDFCMDAGIYEFTMGATGDKVKARYTYVYKFEDGEWKIAHHHSSIMPESFL